MKPGCRAFRASQSGVGGPLIRRRPLVHGQHEEFTNTHGSPPARMSKVCNLRLYYNAHDPGGSDCNPAIIWMQPRGVIAKVEWHPGAFYPRVGFIITQH